MRFLRLFFLMGLMGLIAACGRNTDPEAEPGGGAANSPKMSYARRMLFVGGPEASPVVVAFDYAVLAGPLTIERSAGLWRVGAELWDPLLILQWSDSAIREPWRLIPHGPLRIMVDDTGEIETLRARGEMGEFRLSPETRLVEWSPDELARYQISMGEWRVGAEKIAGFLVDIQAGAEGVHDSPAPAEVVLTDGADLRLTMSVPASVPGNLWLQRGDQPETIAGVLLVRNTPREEDGWRMDAQAGRLHGEFKPFGAVLEVKRRGAAGEEIAPPVTLQAVRGWVEIRGDRRSVFGIMRRAPE
jgi:hypothetical protein